MVRKKKSNKVQQLVPSTERKASGSNWQIYKSLFSKAKVEKNSSVANAPIISQQLSDKFWKSSKKTLVTQLYMDPTKENIKQSSVVKRKHDKTLTKQVAMDCEMVGIGDGKESMIARVSIVNKYGDCIYDKYVKPREQVVDYRTAISGIRPDQLRNGENFIIVQKEVSEILRGRILVGHALKHDLDVLYLSHPRRYTRDTSRYKPFRQLSKGRTPSLKKLTCDLLGREIQVGEHNSIEDAKAAMQLYMLYKNKWESERKWH